MPWAACDQDRSAGWADCRGGRGWRGGRPPTPGGRCRGEVRAGGLRRALRSVSREQAGSGVAQGGPGSGAPPHPGPSCPLAGFSSPGLLRASRSLGSLSAASCSPDSRTTQGASLWEPSVARCQWSAAHSGEETGCVEWWDDCLPVSHEPHVRSILITNSLSVRSCELGLPDTGFSRPAFVDTRCRR